MVLMGVNNHQMMFKYLEVSNIVCTFAASNNNKQLWKK